VVRRFMVRQLTPPDYTISSLCRSLRSCARRARTPAGSLNVATCIGRYAVKQALQRRFVPNKLLQLFHA
jgi:hypothetical protein